MKKKSRRNLLTQKDFDHVVQLANLPVTAEQSRIFLPQLAKILDYVATVRKLKTEKVEETAQVTGSENVFRDDVIEQSLPPEKVLQNVPVTHNGFIVVKRILEEK